MDGIDGRDAIGKPAAVVSRLCAWGSEPVTAVVTGVLRVAEPAKLVELVTNGTADCAVGSTPEGSVDELGEGVTSVGRPVCEMFGDQFPAVVPGGYEVFVGAVEERDIGFVPIPVAIVPP